MKNLKITFSILITAIVFALFFSSTTAYACKITFGPDNIKVNKNGTAKVTVFVKWEHRKCVLDDDDITIDYTGMTNVSQSGWTKIKRGFFKNDLIVKMTNNKGTIRVWRECSKKGLSEGILKLSKNNSPSNSKDNKKSKKSKNLKNKTEK